MEHRRSWHTSFRPFQVRSDAACRADDIGALAKKILTDVALTSLSHTPSFTRKFVTHIQLHGRALIDGRMVSCTFISVLTQMYEW